MPSAPKVSQADPTASRPTTPEGRVLDGWGLPLSGPARVAELAGRTDPAIDPAGWDTVPTAAAATPDAAPAAQQD